MDNTLYWVWLTSLSGVFANKVNALLEHFDTIEDIYRADAEEYMKIKGISRLESCILKNKDLTHAEEIVKKIKDIGGYILTYDDEKYPDVLRKIGTPPYVLYTKGELPDWDKIFTIGVVGTRWCTDYGKKAAAHICGELAARGATVISGMAKGIDAEAARATIAAGGKTIAVLGCGIDVVYPPQNKALKKEIEQKGLVMTEYPPGSGALKFHFPERNRIISGLSKGILVVEAPLKSGALITAKHAYRTGKDIFAVPGSIFSETSEGTNRLIKQGAKPVWTAEDIIEEYPFEAKKLAPVEKEIKVTDINDEKYSELDDVEKQIIAMLLKKNVNIEEIRVGTGLEMGELNRLMPMLEMLGFIKKLPGENYKIEN